MDRTTRAPLFYYVSLWWLSLSQFWKYSGARQTANETWPWVQFQFFFFLLSCQNWLDILSRKIYRHHLGQDWFLSTSTLGRDRWKMSILSPLHWLIDPLFQFSFTLSSRICGEFHLPVYSSIFASLARETAHFAETFLSLQIYCVTTAWKGRETSISEPPTTLCARIVCLKLLYWAILSPTVNWSRLLDEAVSLIPLSGIMNFVWCNVGHDCTCCFCQKALWPHIDGEEGWCFDSFFIPHSWSLSL